MQEITGTYNVTFVIVSIIIAILSSYIALDMCSRINRTTGWQKFYWFISSSILMALGIWSMHFLSMLAYKLPTQVTYEPGMVTLSVICAFIGTSIAFYLSSIRLTVLRLMAGSICMGAAIASMHYVGMMAMRLDGMMHHSGLYFYLSILIAIIASCVALLLFHYFQHNNSQAQHLYKLASAITMGIAICGMHYTGMKAAVVHVNSRSILAEPISTPNNVNLAISVMIVILLTQVLAFVSTSTDQKLAEQADQLHYIANHDELTKIPNRRYFEQQLRDYLENRADETAALFFMDLDRFKAVNDTLGHKFGDKLLQLVTLRLSRMLPKQSVIARLGGDEFTLLYPGATKENATQLAQEIIQSVDEVFFIEGRKVSVSTSVGVALIPDNGTTSKEVMRFADIAMYLAKESGRSNYKFFANETLQNKQPLLLESELCSAIANGEIQVFFQPKMASTGDCLYGMEALCRWIHPVHGIIQPAQFIPLAEKNGDIVALDRKMIELVFSEMNKEAFRDLHVAVNISTQQFYNNRFVSFLRKQMQDNPKVDVSKLEIEITEETAIQDVEGAAQTITELKELGIRIALDDFGKGFNSLNYLKQLPVDTLKIDRAFIANLPEDFQDQAIVSSIVTLAKKLELAIVAEGVESQEQLNWVQDLKCDYAQGYMFSKPLQVSDFLTYLQAFNKEHKKKVSPV
jgi:diguanylate cyclase